MHYRILLTPQGRGRYLARHGERVLHHMTDQPLFDCARVLLRDGAKPSSTISTVHENGTVAMASTIGTAARLTVSETDDRGPVFAPYREFKNASAVFRERDGATADLAPARGAAGGLVRKRL